MTSIETATQEFIEYLKRNTPQVCAPVIFGYVSTVLDANSVEHRKELIKQFAQDACLDIEFKGE